MKRSFSVLSVILTCVMLLSVLCIPAYAQAIDANQTSFSASAVAFTKDEFEASFVPDKVVSDFSNYTHADIQITNLFCSAENLSFRLQMTAEQETAQISGVLAG